MSLTDLRLVWLQGTVVMKGSLEMSQSGPATAASSLGTEHGLKEQQITYFPFLMVFLPSRGPRTGSTVSLRFSIRMTSPKVRAVSMAFKNLKVQSD